MLWEELLTTQTKAQSNSNGGTEHVFEPMEKEKMTLQAARVSLLPFEQLPNLPRPLVPEIDLGIEHTASDLLALQPSLASQRRVGFFVSDRSAQTEESDILEVKRITHVIQTLIQDVAQLRKDLNFTQHVLKADYESKLTERATELYCRVNESLATLEKQHQEKVEIVRKSYRAQLANAIQKIAGEYKAYYDELLQGKTGRHDLKIKELKEKVAEQEAALQEQDRSMEQLTAKLRQYEEELGERDELEVPPPLPPGISLEEAEELRSTIDRLDGEATELRAELAAKEDANKKLTRQVEVQSRQLEDERGKVAQLKRDMDSFRRKAKADQEKAARMAENQLAALERDMKEKMESAEKEAARKAQEQSDLQRMREQARFQEELARKKNMEEELRAQQLQQQGTVVEGDLEKLQRLEQQQRAEIERLTRELDRTNKTWEMKLAIMQRNFHALKDECFLRHSLQRQSATLHHATVGYAVSGHSRLPSRSFQPLPKIRSGNGTSSDQTTTGTSTLETDTPLSLPPPPSPQHSGRDPDRQPSPTRSVHFNDSHNSTPLCT